MSRDFFERQKLYKYGPQLEKFFLTWKGDEMMELKRRVRSILLIAVMPCRVSKIEEDYRNWFGEEFPVRELGYGSLTEVLKMMPEVCEINEGCSYDPYVSVIITEKNEHIYDLVRKNKTKPKEKISFENDVFVPFTVQDAMRRILIRKKFIKVNDFYRELETEFDFKFMKLDDVNPEKFLQNLPHILCVGGGVVKRIRDFSITEIEVPECLRFKDEYVIPSYRISNFEREISKNISSLISENGVIPVMDIPQLYLKKFGKELNCIKLGFQDLWRFLSLLIGPFVLIKHEGRHYVAKSDKYLPNKKNLKEINPSKYCGIEIYKQVLRKVKMLVMFVSTGLNVIYLQSMYETFYFEKIQFKTNMQAFLSDLVDFGMVCIEKIGKDSVLFPFEGSDKLDEEVSPEKVIPKQVMKFDNEGYPMDVLKPGDALKVLNLTEGIKPTKQVFCAAYVTHVENPNDFNLRLIGLGENYTGELEQKFNDMLLNMGELYMNSKEFDIPVELLRIGMVCAACVSGFWQRSKIVDVYDFYITVRLLDVGKCESVTLQNLKFLPQRFADLPILNFKASLFNIKPVNLEWSASAIIEFGYLITENCNRFKELSVLIVLRGDEDVFQVLLTDVNNTIEIHIGDELVDCGYAEFKCSDKTLQSCFT